MSSAITAIGDLLNLIIGTDVGRGLLGLAGGIEQEKAEEEARGETEARFDESRSILDQLQSTLLQDQRQSARGEQNALERIRRGLLERGEGTLADVMAQINAQNARTQAGFRRREAQGLADLEGLGDQARSDINRFFGEGGREAVQSLRDRGLGSSSLVAGAIRGNERERSDALSRLREQLTRERVGIRSQLSGDSLLAQERGFGRSASARERLMGSLTNMDAQLQNALFQNLAGQNLNRQQLQSQTSGNIVNLLASRNDIPPSIDPLLQMAMAAGQGTADAPESPSSTEQILGSIAGPVAGAGTAAIAKIIIVVCIDGESLVCVPGGQKPLAEFAVGDEVLDWYGNTTTVTDMDYGIPHEERHHDFIRIQTDLTSIVCTGDHLINDVPADSYGPGDKINGWMGPTIIEMTVKEVEPWRPVACGDLKLANGHGYICQGMFVNSMFTELQLER